MMGRYHHRMFPMCPESGRMMRQASRRSIAERLLTYSVVALCATCGTAAAQSVPARYEAGVQVTTVRSSEFDTTDIGLGGWFGWRPAALLRIEAEISAYPSDLPEAVPFSKARTEGLF